MMTENKNKKIKYEQENRSFNNEWEENFFFIAITQKHYVLLLILRTKIKKKLAINFDIMKPIILSLLISIHQIPN